MAAGTLRTRAEIVVESDADLARVTYGLWEIEIPLRGAADAIGPFVRREVDWAHIACDVRLRGMAQLLDRIGALTLPPSMLDNTCGLLALHSSLLVEWYADHYGTSFWSVLSSGRASRAQVAAWVARTYFLSRSVGASASKGALFSNDAVCRKTFLKNALEEYDHCRDFYGSSGPVDLEVLDLQQPPISWMIDAHFRAMAECDQWGHALSALYQERTAMFSRDAVASYDLLKSAYGLQGSFDGWKAHLGVDRDEDHAGDFVRIFEPNRSIARIEGLFALTHAWTTSRILKASIDQLLDGEQPDVSNFEAHTPYTIRRLRWIFLKALSNAVLEEHMVLFGDLLTAAIQADRADTGGICWRVGLHNVLALNELQDAAGRPLDFVDVMRRCLGGDNFHAVRHELEGYLNRRSVSSLDVAREPVSLAIEDAQVTLDELLGGGTIDLLASSETPDRQGSP